MSEYASRDTASSYASTSSSSPTSAHETPKRSPAERASDAIATAVRDVNALAGALDSVKRAVDAKNPVQWHAEKETLDRDLAIARKQIDAARTTASDADAGARAELARAEGTLAERTSAAATFTDPPRGWSPVSREEQILAVFAAPVTGAKQSGYAEKEAQLKAELAQLTPAESQRLATRLSKPMKGDPIASAFSRLNSDRQKTILHFLGDSRKRAALAQAGVAPATAPAPSPMSNAIGAHDSAAQPMSEAAGVLAVPEPEPRDAQVDHMIDAGGPDLDVLMRYDGTQRRALARRVETYRPGNGDSVGARFVQLSSAARVLFLSALRAEPAGSASPVSTSTNKSTIGSNALDDLDRSTTEPGSIDVPKELRLDPSATPAPTSAPEAAPAASPSLTAVAKYLHINSVDAWNAISKALDAMVWPKLPVRLECMDTDLTRALRPTLHQALGNFDVDALSTLLYPHDVVAAIEPYLASADVKVFPSSIGIVLGQIVHAVLAGSVPRMAQRYVDVADSMYAAAPKSAPVVKREQLVTSHPMDIQVANALTVPGVATVDPDSDVLTGKRKVKNPALRDVKLSWEGEKDPALWNFVRANPADATPEEVAASLFAYARDAYHADSTSFLAYGIAAAPPLFGLPASWAVQFPEARAHAPATIKAGKLPDLATDTIGARLTTLATSSASDALALQQTPHDAHGRQPSRDEVLKTFDECTIQLEHLRSVLVPWELSTPLIGETIYIASKRSELEHAAPDQIAAWAPVVTGQRDRLRDIADAVQDVMKAAGTLGVTTKRNGKSDPLRDILGRLAEAAGSSHLAKTCDQILAEARGLQASLSLRALQANVASLENAVQGAEAVTGSDKHAVDISRPYGQTMDDARRLENTMLNGGEVDPEELERVQLDAQELALRARVHSLQTQIDQLGAQWIQERAGLISHVVATSRFKDIFSAGLFIHQRLGDVYRELNVPPAKADNADPKAAATAHLAAKRDAVARAQQEFSTLYKDQDLANFFRNAYDALKSQQLRTALAQAAVMIGISIASAGLGNMVGEGLAEGYLAAQGVETVSELSLGARAAIQAGMVGTEVMGNAIGQTITTTSSFGDAVLDNAIFVIGSAGTSKALGKLLEDLPAAAAFEKLLTKELAQIESQEARAAIAMSKVAKVGSAIAWTAKQGAAITGHTVMGMAIGYVVQRVHEAGNAHHDSAQLSEWLIQGASVAIGRFIHASLGERMPSYQRLAQQKQLAQAKRLYETALRAQHLAAIVTTSPEPHLALEVLNERIAALEIELDVLNEAERTGTAGSREDIAKERAGIGTEMSALRSGEMLDVRWRLGGLDSLGNGVWAGSPERIAAAVEDARAAGYKVEPAPDRGDGVTRAAVNGAPVELHAVGSEHAPPTPAHGAGDKPARTPYGDVWPGEVPERAPPRTRKIFEDAKKMFDGELADGFRGPAAARILWAEYLGAHGVPVEGYSPSASVGSHEIYEPEATVRVPAPSDFALPRDTSLTERSPNTGTVTKERCLAALVELVGHGSTFADVKRDGNVLHVPLADGGSWTITVAEPRPTERGQLAALQHGAKGDTVWVSDTLTDDQVPRGLGAIIGESLASVGRAPMNGARFGELDAMFAHRDSVAATTTPEISEDAQPKEIKSHAAALGKAEQTARIDAEIDLVLRRMGVLEPGPRREEQLANMPPELAARVRARLAQAPIAFHPEAVRQDAGVARPKADANAESYVLPEAPANVHAYGEADLPRVVELRVELQTIKELDARIAQRDRAGTNGGRDIAKGETQQRLLHVQRAKALMAELQLGGDTEYVKARLGELAVVFPGIERDVVPAVEQRLASRDVAQARHHEADAFRAEREQARLEITNNVKAGKPFTTRRVVIGDGFSGLADVATLRASKEGEFLDPAQLLVLGGPDTIARMAAADPSFLWGQRPGAYDRGNDAHPAFSDDNARGNNALNDVVEDKGEFMHVGEVRDAMDLARKRFGIAAVQGQVVRVETAEAPDASGPPWEVDAKQYPVRLRVMIDGEEHYIYAEYTDITSGPGTPRAPNEQVLSPTDRQKLTDPKSGAMFSGEKLLEGKNVSGKRVLVLAFGPTGAWAAITAAKGGATRVDFAGLSGGSPGALDIKSNEASFGDMAGLDRLQDVVTNNAAIHVTMDRIVHIKPDGEGAVVTYARGPGENAELYQVKYDAIATTMGYDSAVSGNGPGGDPSVKGMIGDMKMIPQRGTRAPVTEDEATGRVRVMGFAGADRTNVDPEVGAGTDREVLDQRAARVTGTTSADSPDYRVVEGVGQSSTEANKARKGSP